MSDPGGGVQGTVAGDMLRTFGVGTMAQVLGSEVQKVVSPLRFALPNPSKMGVHHSHVPDTHRLGRQRSNHRLRRCRGDFRFDISASLTVGLHHLELESRILPLVTVFHGAPSCHTWEDDVGALHLVPQGKAERRAHAVVVFVGSVCWVDRSGNPFERRRETFAYFDDANDLLTRQ